MERLSLQPRSVAALITLYVIAGALGLTWLALPHPEQIRDGPMAALCAFALVAGAAMWPWRRRLIPVWVLHALLGFATLMVGVGVVLSDLSYNSSSLFFLWATPYAFLGSRAMATFHMSLLAATLAGSMVVQAALSADPAPAGEYLGWGLVVMVTVLVMGVLVRGLTGSLRSAHAMLARGFEDAAVGMAAVTGDGRLRLVNQALVDLLGYERQHLIGRHVTELIAADDQQHVMAAADPNAAAPLHVGCRLRRADGSERRVELTASWVAQLDDLPGAYFVQVQDVTARAAAEAQLRHRSLHDPLTGLANRSLLLDRLGEVLGRGTGVGVLFLDLDDFKHVNDSLGHDAGDELLRAVAPRLANVLRDRDMLARFGGDEFVILCDGGDADTCAAIARRLQAAVEVPIAVGGSEFLPRVSIGIAVAQPGGGVTPDALLRDADVALYRAKAAGKSTHRLFDAQMREETVERVRLLQDLRHAIERNELHVAYQPIVSVDRRRVVAVEALLRWTHPQHGSIPPARFIPLAEQNNLIGQLGDWVLSEAICQASRWRDGGPPSLAEVDVAVNVSRLQLCQAGLAEFVAGVLDRRGLPPQQLTIELTESALAEDPVRATETISALSRLGVRVALDDFGTGQSSLGSLRDFPLDRLKLDRAFLRTLPGDAQAATIVRAVIEMAGCLDLEVVAEGVEADEQAKALRDLGCDLMQGFGFAHPVPADELPSVVAEVNRQLAPPLRAVV